MATSRSQFDDFVFDIVGTDFARRGLRHGRRTSAKSLEMSKMVWHQAQIMARRHASIFDEYQIQCSAVPVINIW
jgi:hypothetical protein